MEAYAELARSYYERYVAQGISFTARVLERDVSMIAESA